MQLLRAKCVEREVYDLVEQIVLLVQQPDRNICAIAERVACGQGMLRWLAAVQLCVHRCIVRASQAKEALERSCHQNSFIH
jgi:hypothetical protein